VPLVIILAEPQGFGLTFHDAPTVDLGQQLVVAELLDGAAVVQAEGCVCCDLRIQQAAVKLTIDPALQDSFLSPDGFKVLTTTNHLSVLLSHLRSH
jgi:hypothetical protein